MLQHHWKLQHHSYREFTGGKSTGLKLPIVGY